MFRNLLILLVFLGVGFGANVAQSDIFVRQGPKAENKDESGKEKKRSIFLRPFKSATTPTSQSKTTVVNKSSAPLLKNTGNVPQQLVQDMKFLNYWRKVDRVPETLDEMRTYASAMRAPDFARVVEARNKLVPILEASVEKQFAELEKKVVALAPKLAAVAQADEAIVSALGVAAILDDPESAAQAVIQNYGGNTVKTIEAAAKERERQASKAERGNVRIYRDPSADEGQEPSSAASRVYKNYR